MTSARQATHIRTRHRDGTRRTHQLATPGNDYTQLTICNAANNPIVTIDIDPDGHISITTPNEL